MDKKQIIINLIKILFFIACFIFWYIMFVECWEYNFTVSYKPVPEMCKPLSWYGY